MNINVITKFNIGDTVYMKEHYYDHWYISKAHKVTEINVVIRQDKTNILYTVQSEHKITTHCPEDWLFVTSEEGAEWCKKHNCE